ncbi:titin-like, partial [Trifolium medium]|nr:titin-like [Trifolium medium]
MHVEPNEPFEEENVNNRIFNGRETKMFHEIEQTKDVNEKGANIGHSLKKVRRDKYEKIQNEGIKENVKESSMKPFEANEDVHKDFGKPKMESKDGDPEFVREKPNKEAVEGEINEEIQNYLPKSTNEQNEGLNVQKRREIKDVKENVVKRKGKEIEYFVEKGEGDRLKSMHVKAMK